MLDYTRQRDIVNPERLAAIHIDLVGLGGIGSPTGMLLTKMGCSDVRAIDSDRVELVNLASQLYRLEDMQHGRPKALAAQAIWHAFSGVEAQAVVACAEEIALGGIVILGVDSMAARRAIWEQRIRDQPHIARLIDARMGAENGIIFTINPHSAHDQQFYELSLYTDAEGLPLPCSGRAVLYNTLWIAALIGRQIKRLAMDQPIERRIDFDLASLSLIVDG
jgi:molybdopterin/thiamine biosynthesis adenylyltransferase